MPHRFVSLRAKELVTTLLAVTLTAACGDDSPTGGAGAGGSGGAPAATYATSECGACVTTTCDAAFATCQADPGCATYLECLLGCPVSQLGDADEACNQACVNDGSPVTTDARIGVDGCRANEALDACTACPAPPKPAIIDQTCEPRTAPTPCRQCSFDNCCDTWDACFLEGVNPDCNAIADCADVCSASDEVFETCMGGCLDAHPDSAATYLEQYACVSSKCAIEQPGGTCDVDARTPCQKCSYEECAESLVALLTTNEGFLTWLCVDACPTDETSVPCIADCANAHLEAKDAFLLWGECVEYRCATKC